MCIVFEYCDNHKLKLLFFSSFDANFIELTSPDEREQYLSKIYSGSLTLRNFFSVYIYKEDIQLSSVPFRWSSHWELPVPVTGE